MLSEYLALLIIVLLFSTLCASKKLVVHVQIVARHGDRTPYITFPTDPYLEIWEEKGGLGVTTEEGNRRMFRVGRDFHDLYPNLFTDRLNSFETVSVTSDLPRTVESGKLIVAGVYNMSNFTNIKVTTLKPNALKANNGECPAFDMANEAVKISPVYKDKIESFNGLISYLKTPTGMIDMDYEALSDFADVMLVAKQNNLTLPEYVTPEIYDQLQTSTRIKFETLSETEFERQVSTGVILNMIRNAFNGKVSQKQLKRGNSFISYVTHDWILIGLIRHITGRLMPTPGYGDAIVFELSRDTTNDEWFVALKYKPGSSSTVQNLKLCGKSNFCSFNQFLNKLSGKTITLSEYVNLCTVM